MKCLVTGAAGFIGSHLCERLIADGHGVVGFDDLSNGKLSNLDSVKNNTAFHFISGDITNSSHLQRAMDKVDWVFHLAAKADIVPSIEAPMNYHNTNVTGTVCVLEAARVAQVKRFVYAASSSCYGTPNHWPTSEDETEHPMYPYALTKSLAEKYVLHWQKVYGLPTISLRLFNVYGPRHRTSGAYGAMFGVFMSQIANNKPVTVVGDGNQTRDFTFVSDVVDAFIKAAKSDYSGFYNIGSGGTYSVNSVADMLGAKERLHIPKRPGEPDYTYANIRNAKAELGYEPKIPIEEGCAIMKELIPQYKDAPLWTPESIQKATKSWFEHLGSTH